MFDRMNQSNDHVFENNQTINNYNISSEAYSANSQNIWRDAQPNYGGANQYLPQVMFVDEQPQQSQQGPLAGLPNPFGGGGDGGSGNPLASLPNPMSLLGGGGGGMPGSDSGSGGSGPNMQNVAQTAETVAPLIAMFA